tara:strand:+ start:168 stop:506 length:339 start_codon:yes stop_codon:yes gene_type:complete
MKYIYLLLFFLFAFTGYSQYKDGISVVQFSAEFVKDNEISLKSFYNHNCYTYYLDKHAKYFKKEKIVYVPTVILFYNGEMVLKIESGVALKLPDNTKSLLIDAIDRILENKF